MPGNLAGTLMYNHWHMDWRDLIPRIDLPTLSISGRASGAATWKSQEWIHRQIKGSQLEVFEEAEGGQHFMFTENPEKFNRIIMKYLGQLPGNRDSIDSRQKAILRQFQSEIK